MRQVSVRIATFILVAWVAALVLNIDIYRKANIELHIFGPIVDAIILVVIALIVFILVVNNFNKTEGQKKWVNISLFILGICTLFFVSFFYVLAFQ